MFGKLIHVRKDCRHNARVYPVAMLLDEGIPTNTGEKRYAAIFMTRVEQPVKMARGNIYSSEIEQEAYLFDEARAREILQDYYNRF